MKEYVREHKITDILFANNIFQACGGRYRAYEFFLTMAEGCKDNPSTAFYKNRAKDTIQVHADTIMPQKTDTVLEQEYVEIPANVVDTVKNDIPSSNDGEQLPITPEQEPQSPSSC
jgi:hypothetical protein